MQRVSLNWASNTAWLCNMLHEARVAALTDVEGECPMQKGKTSPASILARAPAPRTVSLAAQQALPRVANMLPPVDLEQNRRMCAEVQHELGAVQLEKYKVRREETALAGVPVRVFRPPDRSPTDQETVLVNLHGGAFTVDAGSITENVALAACV